MLLTVKMTKDSSRKQSVSSLADLCFQSSLKYLESSRKWDERTNTFIPEDLCTALISKKLKSGHCDDDFVSTYLADVQTSRITKLHMSGARITDIALEFISRHPLREVDVSHCEVSEKALVSLAKCKSTLTTLKMVHCRQITEFKELRHLTGLKSLDVSDTWLDDGNGIRSFVNLVNLRMLNLSGTEIVSLDPLNNLAMLTNLDLSCCREIESIKPLETIRRYDLRSNYNKYEKVFKRVFSSTLTVFIRLSFWTGTLGKISTQPHAIVKQICFPNGNVLFFHCFLYPRTECIM